MSLDSWFIKEHEQIASKFGLSYKQLSQLIYPTPTHCYKTFSIPKKNGKERIINAPKIKLLEIQRQLAEELTQIYRAKPSSHGFIKGKSIVTNAIKHTRKRFVFNIDLEDFFGSIHFGRVRNLFMSSPLNYSKTSATILAQIC